MWNFTRKRMRTGSIRWFNWIVDIAVVIAFACYLVYGFGGRDSEVNGGSMKPATRLRRRGFSEPAGVCAGKSQAV